MHDELLTLHRDLYAVDAAIATMPGSRPATSPASFHLPPVRTRKSQKLDRSDQAARKTTDWHVARGHTHTVPAPPL